MRQRTITPVDGSVYAERELASPELIETALAQSVRSQRSWRQTPIGERVKLLRRMVEWCVARAEELGAELSWQMGRPVAQSGRRARRVGREGGKVPGAGRDVRRRAGSSGRAISR